MKAKIIMTMDNGEVVEGEILFHSISKKKIPPISQTEVTGVPRYKKGSPAYYLWKLKHEKKFFADNQIRTTAELITKLKHSYGKTVRPKHAYRDFLPLVKRGELDRDTVRGKVGKPTYVWFLPSTPQEVIDVYKKSREMK